MITTTTFEAAGRQLSALTAGDGPPLVLLHGSADSSAAWRGVMARLADRWRLVAPAWASARRPEALEGPALPGDLAVLDALIEHLGGRAAVVAHSYGALVALRYALEQPERVSHLGLFEPIAFSVLPERGARLAGLIDAFVAAVSTGRTGDALRQLVDYWNGAGAWDRLPAPVRAALVAAAPHTVAEVRSDLAAPTSLDQVAALRAPTLVLAGAETTAEALAVCRALADAAPGARHLLVPGAGHQMLRSHPDEVARAVAELLSQRLGG